MYIKCFLINILSGVWSASWVLLPGCTSQARLRIIMAYVRLIGSCWNPLHFVKAFLSHWESWKEEAIEYQVTGEKNTFCCLCAHPVLFEPPPSWRTLFTLIVSQKWVTSIKDGETCSILWNDTNIPSSRKCFLPALRLAKTYVYVKH